MNLATALRILELSLAAGLLIGQASGAPPKPAIVIPQRIEADAQADPAPQAGIVFPVLPAAPVVPPAPSPDPAPTVEPPPAVPVLKAGQLYVVTSNEPFFLLASPRESVVIVREQGPIKIRGVFADGGGKVETRNYPEKFLALVDAADGMKGRVELIGVPEGLKDEGKIVRQLLDLIAPRPPPKPEPVDPVLPVDPTPIPNDQFGLGKLAYESKLGVNSPTRSAEAKAIAAAYLAAAKYAEASPYRKVVDIQAEAKKTGLSNEAKLRWKAAGEIVTAATTKLQEDGALVGRLDWAKAFEDLAAGFLKGESP